MRQLAPDDLSAELERNCEYYQQRLMRRLVNLGYGKERAEDYCQDTFLRAWKHIQSQDTPLPQTDYHLENWLRVIAERIAIDENRRKKLIDFVAFPENEAHTQLPPLMVEGHEDRLCDRDRLQEVLAQMPLRHQQIVRLIDYGFKHKDIADELGISPSTVSGVLRDIKTNLQKYYPVQIDLRLEVWNTPKVLEMVERKFQDSVAESLIKQLEALFHKELEPQTKNDLREMMNGIKVDRFAYVSSKPVNSTAATKYFGADATPVKLETLISDVIVKQVSEHSLYNQG